ncbi:MAG TPA: ATP-binding protein [Trichormus sp. M33_DOE_039]|nr:ATP-binding protein [Trichormus sp. M33_DOE_039]
MPRATFGLQVKTRALRLLEALLTFALDNLNQGNQDIQFKWSEEDSPHPKLLIDTKLRFLEQLTQQDKYESKLSKAQIKEALKRMEDYLGILEDHRLKDRGSEDWRFTLTLWSKKLAKNLEMFAELWESRQPEKSKQQFASGNWQYETKRHLINLFTDSQVIPNPFGDVGCITDTSRFFDREELLRQIFEELSKGVNLSLVGESQIGKSSILHRICNSSNLHETKYVYLNLQWVDNEDEFYEALCEEALKIPLCRGFQLTRALSGKRYVLCLDEIEKMTWDGFTKRVRSQLRGLADGGNAPLKLVIASRTPLAYLFPDAPELDSPLAGICRSLDVKPFSESVVRAFIHQRLQGTGVIFSEEEIRELFVHSQGHPARLQFAASNLYMRYVQLSE